MTDRGAGVGGDVDDDEGRRLMVTRFQTSVGLPSYTAARRVLASHSWNEDAAARTVRAVGLGNTPTTISSRRSSQFGSGDSNSNSNGSDEALLENAHAQNEAQNTGIRYLFGVAYKILEWSGLVSPSYGIHGLTDHERFERDFERKYSGSHPRFFQGTCFDALRIARNESKLLLVYLHADMHDDTRSFCLETLCCSDIVDYIDQNFIIWSGSICDQEGYALSSRLESETFPFLAVVAPSSATQLTLYDRIQGNISAMHLLTKLDALLSTYNNVMATNIAQQNQHLQSRSLRQEQDRAYQEALERDRQLERERAEKTQLEEIQKQEREEAAKQRKLASENERARRAALEKERQLILQALPLQPEEGASGISTVQIRLCDGTRISRRFRLEDKVETLYQFVQGHPIVDVEGCEVQKWELLSNYPRREYRDKQLSLADANISAKCTLFVQQLFDE